MQLLLLQLIIFKNYKIKRWLTARWYFCLCFSFHLSCF